MKPKFSLGSMVWFVGLRRVYDRKQCDVCDGTRSVWLRGQTLPCPNCWGTGWVGDGFHVVYSVSERPWRIQAIHIKQEDKEITIHYDLEQAVGPDRWSWPESKLASTTIEAEAITKKLNALEQGNSNLREPA